DARSRARIGRRRPSPAGSPNPTWTSALRHSRMRAARKALPHLASEGDRRPPRRAGYTRYTGRDTPYALVELGRRERDRAAVTVLVDGAQAEVEVVLRRQREGLLGHVADRDRVGPVGLGGLAPDDLVAREVRVGVGVP